MIRLEQDPRVHMAKRALERVGRTVLVCSAKGGVGKSTVAVGLALGLSKVDRKVGLLDLDLQGTCLRRILRVAGPFSGDRLGLNPVLVSGIKVVSTSAHIADETLPVAGAASEALVTGLLSQVKWGKLDYLVVDMPPGMGEELMTFLRIAGQKSQALLVTTPSRLSLDVVRRMASLLKDENVNLLGVVENMSYISCRCGEVIRPFGSLNESDLGQMGNVEMLIRLPIDPELERAFSSESSVLDCPVLGKELMRLSQLVDARSQRTL